MKYKFSLNLFATILLNTISGYAQLKNEAYLKEMVCNSTLMRELDTTWCPLIDSNTYDEVVDENGEITKVKTGTRKVNIPDMNRLSTKNVYLVDTSGFFSPGTKCLIGKLNVHVVKTPPKNKRILYSNVFMLHHGIKNDDHIFLILNKPTNMYEQYYFHKNGPAEILKIKGGQF